jgi:hypothetical protein
MSDAAMYAYIKKLVHSPLKSTRQKKSNKKLQKRLLKRLQKKGRDSKNLLNRTSRGHNLKTMAGRSSLIPSQGSSTRTGPHTAPEKRVQEKRVHHIMLTYNKRNKEKADSNTSSSSSFVVTLHAQAKTKNTYFRDMPAVLAHPDTQSQM